MISVSVPGKIHLIGEHSVVYGKPAILSSINLYVKAKISPSKTKEILGLTKYDDTLKDLQDIIENKIQERFNAKVAGYKIEIDASGIPIGSGLGTSAALSAAVTICLLRFLKIKYSKEDVFDIAYEGEKIFHGNPSGGDLAAVLNNGLTYFKKNPDNSKTITPLTLNHDLNFLLIDSGKPVETTADMVNLVLSSRARRKDLFQKLFDSQEDLTNQMIQVLKNWNEDQFINILKAAERNLEKMGVVGEHAKSIIRKIEKLNGAAKITGGGGIKKGSGMILAFHEDINTLIKFARENKLKYYSVEISDKGIEY